MEGSRLSKMQPLRTLMRLFGDAYRDYCARVHRWV
jgi:hypothetical protein